ncbi:MAG: acyl-CoA thioesterase [Dehalococcoidia bacterium]|nr:acyl-CoA thioesterase [Dehalococcoidia bacterium]
MEGRTVEHSAITLVQVMMPDQANPSGNVHGGETMKLMDTAAGVAAVRHSHANVVTARVEGINFYSPIRVGNLVQVEARLTFVSRSTMEVRINVVAEDMRREITRHALTAYFVMVALDDQGKPTEVPPLILVSDKEREMFDEGRQRHQTCKGELEDGRGSLNVCREEAAF